MGPGKSKEFDPIDGESSRENEVGFLDGRRIGLLGSYGEIILQVAAVGLKVDFEHDYGMG